MGLHTFQAIVRKTHSIRQIIPDLLAEFWSFLVLQVALNKSEFTGFPEVVVTLVELVPLFPACSESEKV